MSSTDPAVESRWWYLVAAVALWTVLSWVVAASYLTTGRGGTTLALLAYSGFLMPVFVPVGIYFDGTRVRDSGAGWRPNLAIYVAAGILGIVVPLVGFVTAAVYLYRRHVHLGVP